MSVGVGRAQQVLRQREEALGVSGFGAAGKWCGSRPTGLERSFQSRPDTLRAAGGALDRRENSARGIFDTGTMSAGGAQSLLADAV